MSSGGTGNNYERIPDAPRGQAMEMTPEEEDGILRPPRRRRRCGSSACQCCGDNSRFCNAATIVGVVTGLLLLALCAGLVLAKIDDNTRFRRIDAELSDLRRELAEMQTEEKSRIASLKDSLKDLRNREDSFESDTKTSEAAINKDLKGIHASLDEHEQELERLNNGTSNADVLDELQVTKQLVKAQLQAEDQFVQKQIAASAKNVSMALQENKKQLKLAQSEIDAHLAATEQRLTRSVNSSVQAIEKVQRNVTAQMGSMSSHVRGELVTLTDIVDAAKVKIHSEVETVQDDIAQYVAVTNKKFAAENDFVKYQLAGTFTLLGCLISLWHLTSHLRHYHKPDVQRRIMAVLWMVPIYSVTCWLSLVFPSAERVLGTMRDCYEAYVIYTFIALLIAVLEDGKGLTNMINKLAEQVVEDRTALIEYNTLLAEQLQNGDRHRWGITALWSVDESALRKPHEHIKPPWPCCYVRHRPTSIAAAWLYQCQLMAFQFVVLKPLLTVIPLVLFYSQICDVNSIPMFNDHSNSINWAAPNIYILFVENVSVAVAFWGLLCFYHGAEKDLEWCNPWPKFLCIKGVVFATFWQSLVIQLMGVLGWIDNRQASQISNLLICIEMLLASLAHFYIFPHHEWAPGFKKQREKGIMLKDTLALRDFVKDMRLMVTSWNIDSDGTIDTPSKAQHQDPIANEQLAAVEKYEKRVQQQQLHRHQRLLQEAEEEINALGDVESGFTATAGEQTGVGDEEQVALLLSSQNHSQISKYDATSEDNRKIVDSNNADSIMYVSSGSSIDSDPRSIGKQDNAGASIYGVNSQKGLISKLQPVPADVMVASSEPAPVPVDSQEGDNNEEWRTVYSESPTGSNNSVANDSENDKSINKPLNTKIQRPGNLKGNNSGDSSINSRSSAVASPESSAPRDYIKDYLDQRQKPSAIDAMKQSPGSAVKNYTSNPLHDGGSADGTTVTTQAAKRSPSQPADFFESPALQVLLDDERRERNNISSDSEAVNRKLALD